ncbi:carboxypeptidase M32 [Planktothrix agardhii]|uniref:carboxypeptidase M32 n=1 Tax=Planktothrix agardhii TaxID=1160 RepID=UPI001F32E50B|nr:carboxypeptidase M32 [Planktothrix agardhii]MCF3575857.1 carboxypeptidase M32 [Planktothrix agardhii 1812]
MSVSSSPNPKYTELLNRLTEINDIKSAISLLYWDQATYMPPGGAPARGRQMATLRRLAHEKFTDPVLGELLEDLRTEEANRPYPSLEASLIRVTCRDYQRAVRVPSKLMAQISQHQSACYHAWAKAREAQNFAIVQPYLKTTLELSQEYALCFPGYEHIADPLIDQQDQGMTVAKVRSLFEPLREQLVAIVEQARLWENVIGRSRGFWEWFYPRLQGVFMRQLGQVTTNQFYQAINKVTPSLIRTDADEVTYNLHIMIRFDLELAMLEGKLAISDLPEAWNERYKKDLGVIPTTDIEGVLQDVHWYIGLIGGMFQSYTLGNLMAAQIYHTIISFDPEIPFEIERGNVKRLLEWLQQNIYQHGRKFTTSELMEQVTGSPLKIDPFIHYLHNKYEYLYNCKF